MSGLTTRDSTTSINSITSGIGASLNSEGSSAKSAVEQVGTQTRYWMMARGRGSHVGSAKGLDTSHLTYEDGGFDGRGCWRWRGLNESWVPLFFVDCW